ncbi:hypothetical protein FPV67DRAFT_720588 [Lyophyllum atratum]|nr:hypothetical protein FPV67DRAFT_720588 [Lyophyllum atratum]
MEKSCNYTGLYINEERAPKVKKGEPKRTRGDVLRDLSMFAKSHNGDTLTFAAWHFLGLVRDISRAETHFLAVTVRRTASSNPRTYYSFADAEVLPWSALEAVYANRMSFADSSPAAPRAMFRRDAEQRKRNDGALGSVMVISIELPKGENMPPREALKELVIHTMQPLGLFKEHKACFSRYPTLPREIHLKCMQNCLKGGKYDPAFYPHTPEDD